MASTATKTSELLRMAGTGPLRTRDVDAAGIPRVYLQRMCERGLLERVDRGLYRLPDSPVTELTRWSRSPGASRTRPSPC